MFVEWLPKRRERQCPPGKADQKGKGSVVPSKENSVGTGEATWRRRFYSGQRLGPVAGQGLGHGLRKENCLAGRRLKTTAVGTRSQGVNLSTDGGGEEEHLEGKDFRKVLLSRQRDTALA